MKLSPPRLVIPGNSGSPPGNSPANQTGRPPMWTKSKQRKMTRLYVYTTLPLTKIVELIHANTSQSAPGYVLFNLSLWPAPLVSQPFLALEHHPLTTWCRKESAHKKLNALLDKEPRWLHPRNNTDMERRVTELSNSPTRLQSATNAAFGHSRSTSNTSRISPISQDVKMEGSASPAPFSIMPSSSASTVAPVQLDSSLAASHGQRQTSAATEEGEQDPDDNLFTTFLRRTTCLSNSTNNTTGSFHRVLAEYSEPYVQTVKRLVKRFTAPVTTRSSLSPFREGSSTTRSWVDDETSPPSFEDRPFPIPGDFLNLDYYSQSSPYGCFCTAEAHDNGRCLRDLDMGSCVLPWVSRSGLTRDGERLLASGPNRRDVGVYDMFGNSVLHFLAARGSIEHLIKALDTDFCKPLIGATNSASQTFLHVMNQSLIQNPDYLQDILGRVDDLSRFVDRLDIYGRSFFHMLQAEEAPDESKKRALVLCEGNYNKGRDAFGLSLGTGHVQPASSHMNPDAMDLDAPENPHQRYAFSPISNTEPGIARESRLLESVRLAGEGHPLRQDEQGRNGLHCLAAATLSNASINNKYHLQEATTHERQNKAHKDPENLLDSSRERLGLRQQLVIGLLEAGVDPNQYDGNGNTPLMAFAAELPEDDDNKLGPHILKFLVQKGANVHARNRCGETALHIAVRCGRKLAMRALVQAGANVHVRDSAGRSLLDVADAKMMSCSSDDNMQDYAHFEACRAWLSGKGYAVQQPTVADEWAC